MEFLWPSPALWDPVGHSLLASLSKGSSRKKNSGVGFHVLLEHQISCCPSHHLVLTGTDSNPPGQPQEQTPVDDSHAEVEIKPQLKPKGTVAKEEDRKLPTHD